MAKTLTTNICCLDVPEDCIAYLRSEGFNVYKGTLGSVFSIQWDDQYSNHVSFIADWDFPLNLLEFHVFIHDMGYATKRIYHSLDHVFQDVESPRQRHLVCYPPVTSYDLRPLGSEVLHDRLKELSNHRRIEIIFAGNENSVEYKSDCVGYSDIETIGPITNYDPWRICSGKNRYGVRVECEENNASEVMFEGKLDQVEYYKTFSLPMEIQGDKEVVNSAYLPLLKNEAGECVAYCVAKEEGFFQFILPQVVDKPGLLKKLFEGVLFRICSEFFPEVEARQWIHNATYMFPEERRIQQAINNKKEEHKIEIGLLEKQAKEIHEKYSFLRQLLTGTGKELVLAVKSFLEWLGFENVVDKDEIVISGEIKEEDLCFEYEDNLVLIEIKGINGTSTDAECSQIDKIVSRRMRALKSTAVHGVYIVNNQKNTDPLKRQAPPFNDVQINDAVNQSRTLVYTSQLFALCSDIEMGFVSKEVARRSFLQAGVANFHENLLSIGVPYEYYQRGSIICLDLNGVAIAVGDTLFYKDGLQRLISVTVESIEQDKCALSSATFGKTGIKVSQEVPRNKEIYILTHGR